MLFNLLDDAVCAFLHITMEQLDYITEKASIEELDELMNPVFNEDAKIGHIRRSIQLRDKYLKQDGIWIQIEAENSVE